MSARKRFFDNCPPAACNTWVVSGGGCLYVFRDLELDQVAVTVCSCCENVFFQLWSTILKLSLCTLVKLTLGGALSYIVRLTLKWANRKGHKRDRLAFDRALVARALIQHER